VVDQKGHWYVYVNRGTTSAEHSWTRRGRPNANGKSEEKFKVQWQKDDYLNSSKIRQHSGIRGDPKKSRPGEKPRS